MQQLLGYAHGGLSKNDPHGFMYLNALSSVDEAFDKNYECGHVGEGVILRVKGNGHFKSSCQTLCSLSYA